MSQTPSKTFGLVGVCGFVAPRHLQAIKQNNGTLLCAIDKHDSVGILDSYFPQADFFTQSERFERHLDKLKRNSTPLDYLSICSPNHLHDTHIRLALRNGASAICEKPLVLNPWNLDALLSAQNETNKHIYSILQLRLHPSILSLKTRIEQSNKDCIFDIDLSYITARGKWYFHSWKGDESKSGGVVTNIGVHFFDMLIWIFGDVEQSIVHYRSHSSVSGILILKKARVRWFLSIDENLLPQHIREQNKRVYRSLSLQGEEFAFSDGFNDLHTLSYTKILNNEGFSCEDSRKAIELTYHIRNATPIGLQGDYHPLNKRL
ncbi:oxidoreductase [Helicobacter cinaedi]|uniref:Gfo/Idh/MocA family oxidoreductase n=1 Tax=Helicobacter cinaedi TaxID=213 RepID=UPI001F25AB58|nr:Gfo/Idh/MocA family oxidoreductase [Helicobacter cinaedi]BDB64652.1 oxidoreductase [Helicobacter cinaedi]